MAQDILDGDLGRVLLREVGGILNSREKLQAAIDDLLLAGSIVPTGSVDVCASGYAMPILMSLRGRRPQMFHGSRV
jgi:hypothetical protein